MWDWQWAASEKPKECTVVGSEVYDLSVTAGLKPILLEDTWGMSSKGFEAPNELKHGCQSWIDAWKKHSPKSIFLSNFVKLQEGTFQANNSRAFSSLHCGPSCLNFCLSFVLILSMAQVSWSWTNHENPLQSLGLEAARQPERVLALCVLRAGFTKPATKALHDCHRTSLYKSLGSSLFITSILFEMWLKLSYTPLGINGIERPEQVRLQAWEERSTSSFLGVKVDDESTTKCSCTRRTIAWGTDLSEVQWSFSYHFGEPRLGSLVKALMSLK